MIPKIGLIVYGNASNTAALTSMIALEIIEENPEVGILSLLSLANGVERQVTLIKKLEINFVDGCHNECSKKIVDRIGIKYERYINLENDFGYKKLKPFTTFEYSENDVKKISSNVIKIIKPYLERVAT